MALAKRATVLTPKDKAVIDRVRRAKAVKSPIDRTSNYHEQIAELARSHGLDVADLVAEWEERSAVRQYLGEFDRDEAERLAYDDVSARVGR